ncbi:hypothetical protein CDL60_06880 [Roseateles noduli]|nr:hypothetical protein CDL60_06880 [Roseateles noduli]
MGAAQAKPDWRSVLQAFVGVPAMLLLFTAPVAWELHPQGDMSSVEATLDVVTRRGQTYVGFKVGDQRIVCPSGSLCHHRGLERRHGERFLIERDARGRLFSIRDARGDVLSKDEVHRAWRHWFAAAACSLAALVAWIWGIRRLPKQD